jgi:hypothetical protein
MTRSARTLALQIALLIEENSDRDIREAVKLLERHGHGGKLLEYLSKRSLRDEQQSQEPLTSAKALQDITSRAVLKLEGAEPEKFELLSDFDAAVRHGHMLASNDILRRFGEMISKSYEPRKSRRENISAIMSLLAERTLDDTKQLIKMAASLGANSADEYQNLAKFLIKGKRD